MSVTTTTTTAHPLFQLTDEAYALVEALERLQADAERAARELLDRYPRIAERLQQAREAVAAKRQALDASLDRLAETMQQARARLTEAVGHVDSAALLETRARLSDSYEQLVTAIRAAHLPDLAGARPSSLRPTNYTRNLFHVANALLGAGLYQWVFGRLGCVVTLGSFLLTYVILDRARRIWPSFNEVIMDSWFKAIARPKERYTMPAAIWYAVGVLGVLLLASQTVAQVAVLVVGLGDPAASVIGKRFGRHKLVGKKSLEGTLAFVAACLVVLVPFLVGLRGLALGPALLLASVASVAGAVAELFGDDRIDDNFTVPVVVALAVGWMA